MGWSGWSDTSWGAQPFNGWPVIENWVPRIDLTLASWGVTQLSVCCVRMQLRFTTIYFLNVLSGWIWQEFLNLRGVLRRPAGFDWELEWMVQSRSHNSVSHIMMKLVLSAAIYHTWGERNFRIFRSRCGERCLVLRHIIEDIRACLWGWKASRILLNGIK